MRQSSRIAFKEWAVICEALLSGKQSIFVRKGGIQENRGHFRPEHSEFFLYPTWSHQSDTDLVPEGRASLAALRPAPQAGSAVLPGYAVMSEAYWVRDRAALAKLAPFHFWSPACVESRFAWGGEPGLFVILARIFKLAEPMVVPELESYRGCKSWVELDSDRVTAGAAPVLTERNFNVIHRCVRDILGEPVGEGERYAR